MTQIMPDYKKKYLLLLSAVFFISASLFAREGKSENEEKAFDAGKLIIGHVMDSHEWHVAGHVAIPLPIIIYSEEKGFDFFLSNKEEEHIYHGKQDYKIEGGKIVAVHPVKSSDQFHRVKDEKIDEEATAKLWDFSITKNTATLFITALILLLVFISVAKSYSRRTGQAPKGLQSAMETIIIFVRDDVVKPSIGEKHYKKFLPYLLTLFFFIWTSNLLGLIPIPPGGANLTGNIAVTMTLACFTFIISLAVSKKHYWRHVFAMPGVPLWVLPLITFIEILGVFLKPFVLMIRIFANILAGHIIILSFVSLIFIFGAINVYIGWGVSIFSLAFSVFMTLLELLVALLQAYVFTLLSSIYIGAALEESHPHAEEHS